MLEIARSALHKLLSVIPAKAGIHPNPCFRGATAMETAFGGYDGADDYVQNFFCAASELLTGLAAAPLHRARVQCGSHALFVASQYVLGAHRLRPALP